MLHRRALRDVAARGPTLFIAVCVVALVGCKSPYEEAADEFERAACACRDADCYSSARADYEAWVSGNRSATKGDWRHTSPAEATVARAQKCGAAYATKRCGGVSGTCPPGTECRGKYERTALNPGGDLVFYCLPPVAPAANP